MIEYAQDIIDGGWCLFLMLLKLISCRHPLMINLPATKTMREGIIRLCLIEYMQGRVLIR